MMNLILLLFRPVSIQGREPYLCELKICCCCCCFGSTLLMWVYEKKRKKFSIRLYAQMVWWSRPPSSMCWYQFGWHWPSFKVTAVWETIIFCVHSLKNFAFHLDETQYVATTCLVVETHAVMLNWFCTNTIRGRGIHWHDFMKCFNICCTLSTLTHERGGQQRHASNPKHSLSIIKNFDSLVWVLYSVVQVLEVCYKFLLSPKIHTTV